MSLALRFCVGVAALALPLVPSAKADDKPAKPAEAKAIDLVLCLDVSSSMNGLIDSAKIKLWDIVNEMARLKPTPNLRVALYSYGHSTYDAAKGWVKKDLDLTTDLDDVYKALNALTINGGEEYVVRVTRDALQDQKWTTEAGALKLVFVCGNEPANQDKQVSLDDVAARAKKDGVIINAIYCWPAVECRITRLVGVRREVQRPLHEHRPEQGWAAGRREDRVRRSNPQAQRRTEQDICGLW